MILDETLQRGAVLRDEVLLAHVHDVVGLGSTDLKIVETNFMLNVLRHVQEFGPTLLNF